MDLVFDSAMQKLAVEVINGRRLEKEELLALANESNTLDLMFCAGKIRQALKGDDVQLCAIVNAKSGTCSEDCSFCSQSAHYETGAVSYSLKDKETIRGFSKEACTTSAKHFGIVTSGKSLSAGDEFASVCKTIEEITSDGNILPCASLGTMDEEGARKLRKAGLVRYHHNLETSEGFFPNICTTHSFKERIKTLEAVKNAGMETCSGGIFGLGESWEDRVDLAITLRNIGVHAVPLNFLVAIPGTPLEKEPPLSPMETLKVIALYRFALPEQDIKVCGGRTTNLRDLQSWIFMAGANSMMIGNYLTTAGRSVDVDLNMLKDLELKPIRF